MAHKSLARDELEETVLGKGNRVVVILRSEESVKEYQSEGSYLEIDTLGRFVVKNNQKVLTAGVRSSKKIWTLFMYLLTYRQKSLLPEVIVDHLWPEGNYENPRGLLRTQMHRLRKLMDTPMEEGRSSFICYHNGAYYWNPDVQIKIDADLFEALSADARTKSGSDPQGAVQLFLRALEYYQGDYLPECAGEAWAIPAKVHYRRLFINNVMELCGLLTTMHQYSKVLNVCDRAMLLEPSEESFHLIYLDTLLKSGKLSEAQHHYQYATSLHYRELGIVPSASMKKIYQQIVSQQTAGLILEKNVGEQTQNTAFYCHPTVFNSICQLEKRKSERNGTSNHMCIFSWTPTDPDLSITELDKIEIKVQHYLLHHLRHSDALTRWSDRRFAALFPGLTLSQTKQLVHRLMAHFNDNKKALGIQMTVTIQDSHVNSFCEEEMDESFYSE